MSLARTALRLAALHALRPAWTPDAGPWPTVAEGRVYDSHMEPIDDLAEDEMRPIILVFTDLDTAEPTQPGGSPPWQRMVTMVFEISVVARGESDEAADTFVPVHPVTSAETEAVLDLLEAGLRFALTAAPGGALFRKVARIASMESAVQRSAEEALRIAVRTITVRCVVIDDCFNLNPAAVLAGNDRLPEPLKTVVAALPAGSYGKEIGTALAGTVPAISPLPRLSEVKIAVEKARPSGTPDGNPDATVTADTDPDD